MILCADKNSPLPVPRPDEKGGGLGMGLATPPFKTSIAMERANESHHRLNQGKDDRQPLMTAVEESPQVVTCSMRRSNFDPKETTHYGIWNVQTPLQTGKLAQL